MRLCCEVMRIFCWRMLKSFEDCGGIMVGCGLLDIVVEFLKGFCRISLWDFEE